MEDILWFEQLGRGSLAEAGGKGANLGEMLNAGFPIPNGFVATSGAYFKHLEHNGLKEKISEMLSGLDVEDTATLQDVAEEIQQLIVDGEMPAEVEEGVREGYKKLCDMRGEEVYVAVRSSATAEDLPDASFAGQQSTFLNVHGADGVVSAVKDCWASLFTARAIYYRVQNNFDHMEVGLSAVVQEMVQSEKAGVMFTVNPINQKKNEIMIEGAYGLGEVVVSGSVTPDTYVVDKATGKILSKDIAKQTWMMIKHDGKNAKAEIKDEMQAKQKLPDDVIASLAKLGEKIEKHYEFPQDIEWAYSKGEMFIVQSRPITTLSEGKASSAATPGAASSSEGKIAIANAEVLLRGLASSPGHGAGRVNLLGSAKDIPKMEKGAILVTDMTTPDFVPAMKKASAIVTNTGGMTSHAAIVSRELGIPCVVGTQTATETLKDGMEVTVDGTHGVIYSGLVDFGEEEETSGSGAVQAVSIAPQTGTKIYVNLADADLAEKTSKLPADGVGLLRAEFMVADMGEHPRKMYEEGKEEEFIDRLAEGLRRFTSAFYPRPVVYRATDFKTNEYRNLVGGDKYEPQEENPMMGYRGAARYIAEPELFKMELKAMKKVREEYGMTNLWLMIPFVRRIGELRAIKEMMQEVGVYRTKDFRLWIMVEVPSTVLQIDEFCEEGIDGVSIGTNDLTQLVLGIDRDNATLAKGFDERNNAIYRALETVIKTTAKYGVTSSLCGQAPSVYPEFAEKLVEFGITSMSVNPDAVERTKRIVASAEQKVMLKYLREMRSLHPPSDSPSHHSQETRE
ncbi:phosphoenolpyruvate synthase [Candidatus Micrarchaeota archaeon]|nr:phosphoenolpyruvate synthase [Candidatus Micrarchaeota archaeon]